MTLERGTTVLVREGNAFEWKKAFFGKEMEFNGRTRYACNLPKNFLHIWKYCIPFFGNEALEGTTNNEESKMETEILDISKIKTVLDANVGMIGLQGIFADDIETLKYKFYSRMRATLINVENETHEERYVSDLNISYALFYPLEPSKPSLKEHLQELANKHKVYIARSITCDKHVECWTNLNSRSVSVELFFGFSEDGYTNDFTERETICPQEDE